MGTLLSTIKLYVGELKSSNQKLVKLLNSIIDDAIKSIRSISYNIMPVVLTKNGLDYAVRTFCDKITLIKAIEINIESNIQKERFKWVLEKIIYRVITELINNTLKHSKALSINIKMILQDNYLLIEYFDSGKGFNVEEKLKNDNEGLGLKNIINRIKIIDGIVDIKSNNKGSFFTIKINLKNV